MNSDYKAGFEAGIRAAEAVCRERSVICRLRRNRDVRIRGICNDGYGMVADENTVIADTIAALTPEETDA